MGEGACGSKYLSDDGVIAVDWYYAAAIELWWNEYVVYGGGVGFGAAAFMLY